MAIRLPLQGALSYNNTTIQGGGPASIAGGVAKPFMIPQDTDNVVVKLTASILGGGVSATFQTSDDGGTTWYDVARTSIVSNAGASTGTAEWLSIPVVGIGGANVVTSVVAVGSVQSFSTTTGATAASSLGQKSYSGLPILGPQNRIFLRYTSAVSSIISESVTVSVNNQSATA